MLWETRGPKSHACSCHGSNRGSRAMKCQFVSRASHLDGMDGSWGFCCRCRRPSFLCSVGSTSLTIPRDLNKIVVASRHMFTLTDWLTWVNVGGGCYRLVSEHGSPLLLDGLLMLVMHSCRLHMRCLYLWSMSLLHMHGVGHGCSDVTMWKWMVCLAWV